MGRLKFEDLSLDVKTLILEHITRPTDLVSVCLVNKQLHEIAVRFLYREVSLDIGSDNDTCLASFLSPRNIGIQHVRELDLYLADVLDKCNQNRQANFAIRMILEMLPENALEKFSWHPWSAFSGENLILLYKKQKRMKWLEGIALDANVLEKIQKIPDFEMVFQNVTKLGLYPDTREVLEYCHMLVKNTTKLEKMTLHASFDAGVGPDRELNDSSTGPGLITRTIFKHMQPFAKCTPMALKEITLQKIALRYAADTYCKIVNFRTVKSIKLFSCSGADALLAELSKSTKLPDKLETLVFKHEDNMEEDGLSALDGFLCLVSGIKTLTIDLTNAKTLPAAAGIVRHAKTLESLNVHANRLAGECDEEIVLEYAAFSEICKHCKELEQISVGFPMVTVLSDKTASFAAYEHCLSTLPNLITLNITTFPKSRPGPCRLPRKTYEALLQHLATQAFDTHATAAAQASRTSKLALIAWGSSDKVYDREDSENQIIFAKGRQVDALGKESATAIQISWCLKRYTDVGGKRSNVLDFALSRTGRMPVREVAGSEDSD